MLFQIQQFLSSLMPRQEKAQGLVEYALIIVLIAIVVIVALGLLGTQITDVFTRITTALGGTASGGE